MTLSRATHKWIAGISFVVWVGALIIWLYLAAIEKERESKNKPTLGYNLLIIVDLFLAAVAGTITLMTCGGLFCCRGDREMLLDSQVNEPPESPGAQSPPLTESPCYAPPDSAVSYQTQQP